MILEIDHHGYRAKARRTYQTLRQLSIDSKGSPLASGTSHPSLFAFPEILFVPGVIEIIVFKEAIGL
ncbi:hypothetical protein HanXRQr2_Chr09g0376401 [Helianthus annuus]|uniref:Uncharacterized protein n=1 Tax=Helianthus annuus TaxID=4232 RepID=A0A251TX12_HELAN|nr:hypothetical protein HanXRQr2_Chr09g0376401 [Helianthus annuus]KAJ0526565.1 hypothetical protein HanHA300_Chr09g0324631 [Helianthus annuus]KAJ0535058.1 hypothetical protein HanIR_Chr09g0426551 [Helianthus annuus]KAJ0542961.1 hypothetical protein HanHA89_Chr09g0345571 [Helianthus annuus]KAJ0708016.1 hypothetical protein HanLR1_Chr09g0324901 [Helianthus annuus]